MANQLTNSENALRELQELTDCLYDAYSRMCEKVCAFSDEFAKQLKAERAKLPYQLNLLDELRPNDHRIPENCHSRILCKLLQYKNAQGAYEIYGSLLHYITNRKQTHLEHNEEFGRISIESPVMTQETERIDLWIRDKRYAIILENKINNALDQDEQLKRYIDKTKKEKYKEEDIFVVYLSSDGQEPADQSWGGYKENFANRYVNLSFRYDIYPWLKDMVLPEVRYKDVCLRTALVQYVDYLAGCFYMRETEKQMNMNLDKVIRACFHLENMDKAGQVKVLEEKIEEMREAMDKVRELKDRLRLEMIETWRKQIKEEFPNIIVLESYADEYVYVAVQIEKIEGKPVVVYINEEDGRLFCQVEFRYDSTQEDRVIKEGSKLMVLKDELPEEQPDCIWKWTERDYEATYDLFCRVVKRCIEISDREKGQVA